MVGDILHVGKYQRCSDLVCEINSPMVRAVRNFNFSLGY